MLPQKLSFVDVETTGTSMRFGKIIEIGIVRVENNSIVKKYSSLINPETRIDPFISSFTGISQAELEKAPIFSQILNEILEILEDTIFVAHNVRFDYGFLRSECKRCGVTFTSKHFCTVKLSRILYPTFTNHGLDDIITRFDIKVKQRHRAFDDAYVLWKFFNKTISDHGEEKVDKAIVKAMKRPAIPLSISEQTLDDLPQECGVYIFYDKDEVPLYVGKSINIQERVLSHFASDYLIGKDMKIALQVKRIESIVTAGELGALLLESALIKKIQPVYNRKLRLNKKLIALLKIESADGYMSVKECFLDEIPIFQLSNVFGIFKSKKQMKDFLKGIRDEYSLCAKLLGIEKTESFCFSYHLGSCK